MGLATTIKVLENIKYACLQLESIDGKLFVFGDKNSQLKATIKIIKQQFYFNVIAKGGIGLGESYINKDFETDDLVKLLQVLASNLDNLSAVSYGTIFNIIKFRISNYFKRNTLQQSPKNIANHYDLGNDFYQIWLDASMTYSSALYLAENDNLASAQQNKYRRILKTMTGTSILEIGSGWGGFLANAAKNNYKLTGLTLSKQQKLYCDKLIASNNFDAKVKLQDYRNHSNKYDNIVSIEMIEAVGSEYWQQYFAKIHSCLNSNGVAVIQAITIDNRYFDKYLKSTDYIRQYIFPGGVLPSDNKIIESATKAGLNCIDNFKFGQSYSQTLAVWLQIFNSNLDKVKSLGFDEFFIRSWQFYLCYCIAGFNVKRTDVQQYTFVKN